MLEKEKSEEERLEKERLEKEKLEKERIERQRIEKNIFTNNMLFMIPSWGDLLGHPSLGMYVHHQVLRIITDSVIFLSGYDYSIETAKGTLHYLFGLGYYFLKFEIESGKYITDNRILTGLLLSDFAYDHIATSKNLTLEGDRDVIIAENVIKVPVDLSYKPENRITFIKGALTRNIFIPYKDIFLEMMQKIRKDDSYQVSKNGHMLLSTHWDFYNQILISDKMRSGFDTPYLNSVAGLNGIVFGADQLLQETLSPLNLATIENNINFLKKTYSNLELDPMYLFSILEKASIVLKSSRPLIHSKHGYSGEDKFYKNSIFTSAEDRIHTISKWPVQFKRRAKKETSIIPKMIDQHLYLQKKNVESMKIPEYKQEKFELRSLKSEKVEFKLLPNPPQPYIKQILLYLKKVIEENYEMRSIGQAFELARESMRQIGVSSTTLHQKEIWEMSKYANIYKKKELNLGLPPKEKEELIRKIDNWLFEIEEEERKEREYLERIRLEKEAKEKKEKERIERERQEKEKLERERLEREKLEKERQRLEEEKKEIEKLEKIKKQKEEIQQERKRLKQEQLEKERLERVERERQKKIKLEIERLEKERKEIELIEKEKRELKRLKQQRKLKERRLKQQEKMQKKLEKQKKKIILKKKKEQERLKNL